MSFAPEHTRTANQRPAVPGSSSRLHGAPICSILSSDGFVPKEDLASDVSSLSIFLVLILALGIGVFSAWNWVDDQLNKQTWLTSKRTPPAKLAYS